jgi:protein TonB
MSDTPEKSGKQHPDKDRRAHPRQRIHSLSYVKIGDGNGGIVLNVSEGGISVQAAAVLEAGETLPIWLEIPKVRNRVEVQAEIVWLSASRKEAGLRFVDLEESTLRKIRKWMEREASPEKFEDEPEVVEEEEELPVEVAVAVAQAAPAAAVAVEDTGVRELTEANVMSAEEIKIFESGRDPKEAADPAEGSEETEEASEEAFGVMRDVGFEDETDEVEIAAAASQDDEEELEQRVAAESSEDADGDPVAKGEAEAEEEIEAEAEAKFDSELARDKEDQTAEPEADAEPETEDQLIAAFGPPVVPFERRPHTPFSSMNALASGGRAAQNLAVAPALSLGQAREAQAMVSEPKERAAKESDWKDFRVQLHTGWFLAALVLLLALISFIAGMAVRRGALNQVLGEQQDSLLPRSSPAATATPHNAMPGGMAPAGKPLSIEVVDLANHHWLVPASNGPNHGGATPTSDAAKTADETAATSPKTRDDNSASAIDPNAGKPKVPLVLNLPETPISASGSVAISAQRSVPVPADGSAAQSGRNLQVGQLLNVVEPVYPPDAIKERVEGTVKLHAVVGSDGSIQSLTALSGPKVLIDASLSAVRNWKYSPTRMGGQAIETEEEISFVFRLPK